MSSRASAPLADARHSSRSSVAYRHADEPIGSVEQIYSGRLVPDLAVSTFRNIDRLFPSRIVTAGERPRPLTQALESLDGVLATVNGESYDLYDYLALNQVTGLVVLHRGRIVHETYQRGNDRVTRWMSMSVAKSICSTLAGMAIQDGSIREGLAARVVDYVPALAGSAYDGVSLRDLLMMASGVAWNETYTDPASDRRRLLEAQVAQQPGGVMKVMASLPRAAMPGTVHNYSTGETQILAELVHRAIGRPLADYLSDKLWQPFGMEHDATWWLESPDGIEIGGSGISATLRDYARFGQFMLEGGKIDGEPLLPEGWVAEATRPTMLAGGESPGTEPLEYGYMWWTAWTDPSRQDQAYAAKGIHGQAIYVNPAREIVIAQNAAAPKPLGKLAIDPMAFFDAIVAHLDRHR
ncbi:serine hydrolase [Salinicola sp. MIT1003]|uniref:serine hydrolase domain-containing protein n=1 Tax=Salinicola sp. MIT1003 TaxID=1882734 RepID=UPI0008DDEEBC|nr:serine hydrolase [Salinicola sp. MIT1003]OHY98320.1 serine hydrolase [Salinicola sp. MIT1003]